jgi:hypothetical protein
MSAEDFQRWSPAKPEIKKGLLRVFWRGGIRAVLTEREAEVAYVALLAAIRAYLQRLVQREFHGAVSPGPVE